ncbi:hypothetical protein B1808_05425 [Pseudofulvimonas gallinarii]|nr:hypothetical protein B1808_05425 [Pseudofulvimonas gallinarii]
MSTCPHSCPCPWSATCSSRPPDCRRSGRNASSSALSRRPAATTCRRCTAVGCWMGTIFSPTRWWRSASATIRSIRSRCCRNRAARPSTPGPRCRAHPWAATCSANRARWMATATAMRTATSARSSCRRPAPTSFSPTTSRTEAMTNELRTHARKAHGTTRSASPPPASGQASMLRRVVMTLLLAALSPMAQAAAIIVNTLDDEMNNDGDCSLREAVASANYNLGYDACTAGDSSGWDVILFALPGPGEIPMSQNLVITQAVQIYGGDLVTLRRAPKGASHMIVVDMANPGHDFGLSNIALVDGNNYDGWNRDNAGSAVQLRQADQVTFSNVTFRNNAQSALAHFGGAFPGKQVNSVRVVDCLFERNRATTGTGYTGSGHGGGAIALDRVDNVTVLRSTFRKNGNVDDLPFAYGPGGAIRVQRANSIDISDSLFEQNSARTRSHNGGGAISVEGPYSGTTRAALSVRNSTFVLNRSYADGELLGTDIELVSKAQAIVVNSTFYTADNSLRVRGESELYLLASTVFDIVVAPRIAGLIRTEAYGRISMQASLLFSYASGPLCEHNSIGYIRSNGLNLFPSSDQSCERHSLDTGIEDPRLLPLGYYGGPVPVMLPRPDSPLIDSGGHYCSNISIHTDARGLPRPVAASGVGPALCDLGAVEWNPDHDPIWIDRLFADGFEG